MALSGWLISVGILPAGCGGQMPCLWRSEDGSLTLLLSALQGEQADGSGDLRLDFGIGATPGVMLDLLTSSFVTQGVDEILAGFVVLDGVSSGFSDRASTTLDLSGTDVGLDVSAPLDASIEFRDELPAGRPILERATLHFNVDGVRVNVVFENIPLDSSTESEVNCNSTLPCLWSSSDRAVNVTVSAVERRSVDGQERLGADTGVDATLGFDLETTDLSSPVTLGMNLFEVRERRVPYWNPVFRDLPVQADRQQTD